MTHPLLPAGAGLIADAPLEALPDRPWVSMLLIAYQQPDTIARAIRGALAQTYSPLEIVVSDDASNDTTFATMQAALVGYTGPHRIVLNRNARNLGIGAHLSHLVGLSSGELLFVAAGDDVSLPQRCETVVNAWLAYGRRPDLIASALFDMDDGGAMHAPIVPTELQRYQSVEDWLIHPPFVVGAAQAWTRRLFERFGPLSAGVVAEDLIMVFRAVGSGGAITLPEALVGYGRGGISRRVRNLNAQDVTTRVLKNNRHALVEHEQLLQDARTMGQLDAVQAVFDANLKRERFIRDVFAAQGMVRKFGIALQASAVPTGLRLRMCLYATLPGLYAPFFLLKRLVARHR